MFYFSCSKCQARGAFAMYLVRVQQRLISEVGPSNQDDSDALNEQMVTQVLHVHINVRIPFLFDSLCMLIAFY